MGSLERQIKRQKEIDDLLNIRKTYGKKPKIICPKCHRKSLFMQNKDGNVYCIRCDSLVALGKK